MEIELQKEETRFRLGMIIIALLIAMGPITALFALGKGQYLLVLGSNLIEGDFAFYYNLIFALIGIILIYGIFKRKFWAGNLLILWQIYVSCISIFNYVGFLSKKEEVTEIYNRFSAGNPDFIYSVDTLSKRLMNSAVISIVVGVLIVFYVYKNKDYFVN